MSFGTGGGLFGTPQTGLGRGTSLGGGLGASTGGGLFGRQTGGLFGNTGGGGGGLGAPGTSSGGLFGQTPASQSAGGGLFGVGAGGGLTGSGLGAGAATGGIFQTPQALGGQQRASGLFGQSPILTGSTGGNTLLGGGLFGQASSSGAAAGGGLFSKPQTTNTGLMGGLGQTTGGLGQTGASMFGGVTGTTVKYDATKGTDTFNKNGLTVNVNTLLHCITAASSYSQKSIEELRFEDYSAGRKGPSGTTGGIFGGAQGIGGLGGGGLFGQKSLGTGGPLGGGGLRQNQLGTGLGGTSTAGGSLFGQKLGGATVGTGGLFSSTSTQSGLGGLGGGGGLFGQAQATQAGGGIFGANAAGRGGLFSQSGTGTQLGGQTQLGGGGLFGRGTGTGLGQTGTLGGGLSGGLGTGGLGMGGLGSGTGGLGVLGNQTSQASLGFKPTGTGLGTGLVGGLGTGGLGLGQTQIGGLGGGLTLGGLGTGLGVNRVGGSGLMGTGTTGLGGVGVGGGLGQNSLGQTPLQQQQQEAQLKQQLEILASSPFGDSPLFRSAISDAAKHQKSKDLPAPVASKSSPNSLHYKLNVRPSAKVKPISLSSAARHKEKNRLFEGLEDSPQSNISSANSSISGASGETFVPRNPRKSVKKLNIIPKPSQPHTWPDSTTPPVESPAVAPSPILLRTPTDSSLTPDRTSLSGGNTSTPALSSSSSVTHHTSTTEATASFDTSEITLGTKVLSNPSGIRPLTGILSPTTIGASPALKAQGKKSSPKKVTLTEPVVDAEGPPLTRSPLRHERSPPSRQKARRPCGIILTKPSYYTIPSLDECDGLVENGACNVEGFTIGRQGVGEIHFPGTTDVYGLNLDRIVSIEPKEVVVYPDDLPDAKPEVGEKLNKPAVVSMHEFWPKDKTTRELIKDKGRLERMNYSKKLEALVEKIGGVFLDYKPDAGTCVFQVLHFSGYKLEADESDDEGDSQNSEIKKLKIVQKNEKQLPPQPLLQKAAIPVALSAETETTPLPLPSKPLPQSSVHIDDDESMSDDEEFEDAREGDKPMETHTLSIPPPPQELVGSNTHHVQIMKASFFNENDSLNTTYTVQGQGSALKPHFSFGAPSHHGSYLFSPSSRGSVQQSPALSRSHQSPAISRMLRSSLYGNSAIPSPVPSPKSHGLATITERLTSTPPQATDPFSRYHPPRCTLPTPQMALSSLQAQSAVLMAKRDLLVLVPAKDSISTSKERALSDHGLFLGRSFRVGWGPNWTLVHSGKQVSESGRAVDDDADDKGHPIRVSIERVCANQSAKFVDFFEPFLTTQLANTKFSSVAPLCSPNTGTALLHAFSEVAQTRPFPVSSDPFTSKNSDDMDTERQLRRVLQLAVVLWGDLPPECSSNREMYDNQQARKKRVSQWLKETNKSPTEREKISAPKSDEEYLKSIFSLVAGQQLGEACRLAQQHKDRKLALLLSQATSRNNREFIYHQLSSWSRQEAQCFISPTHLKLYILLAGLMTWSCQDTRSGSVSITTINTCEGLDWKRSLALHLCFSSKPSSPILDLLHTYMNAFQGDDAYAPPPYPPYIEARGTGLDSEFSSLPFDTCYHLLQLYCHCDHSLELTLQPAASTPHLLDYRISWILWSIMTSLEYTHLHPTSMAQLVVSFATQLEHCGKWHWSVFALLHLKDQALLRPAVQELLARNCCSEEELSEVESFVIEKLFVPKDWVYYAKAQRSGYEEWYDLQAYNLLHAEHWNEAHTVIVQHLAVDAIIIDDTDELLRMLEQLAVSERRGLVQGWDSAGSVFLDFLRIRNQFQQLSLSKDTPSQYQLESLHMGVKQLAPRISQLPSDSPRKVLCQSEMAKQTADFTRLILQLKAEQSGEQYPNKFILQEMVPCLRQLPMPPDYAITEYRSLLHLQITDLVTTTH